MTALNGIVQANAVHLLTDGAIYDPEGVVLTIGRKAITIPERRVAISWAGDWYGNLTAFYAEAKTAAQLPRTDMLASLSDLARSMVFGDVPAGAGVDLLIALWDEASAEPQLWTIQSHQDLIGRKYLPFTPVRLRQMLNIRPGTEREIFGRDFNVNDPAGFDPVVDGLALLEAQRRDPWEGETEPQYEVGGFAQLTTVSASGVDVRILKHWPDEVGKKIRPHLDGRHAAPRVERIASWIFKRTKGSAGNACLQLT